MLLGYPAIMRYLLPLLLVVLPACHGSSDGPADTVLAKATIGVGGGEVEVTQGLYAGLRLVVPAGAVERSTEVRFIQPAPPGAGVAQPLSIVGPGPFVRIEPQALEFAVPATLRLPYIVDAIGFGGPGHVRAVRVRTAGASETRYIEAPVVDVVLGRIEFETTGLGGYQVVQAPPATSMADYLPALGSTAQFEDGYSFSFDEVLMPQIGANVLSRWTIDTGSLQQVNYFEQFQMVGRAVPNASWLEAWDEPIDALVYERYATTYPVLSSTRIYEPPSAQAPAYVGQVSLLGRFGFEVPLRIGNREFRDILRIRLHTAWTRPDLGVGDAEQVFWFAPGVGLIQMQTDGVIRIRTDL